jgi:hypothetical protein
MSVSEMFSTVIHESMSPPFSALPLFIHDKAFPRNNGQYGRAYLSISRMAYTMSISRMTTIGKDLKVIWNGGASCCMLLKNAVASAIG